jgi:hypothetical protein
MIYFIAVIFCVTVAIAAFWGYSNYSRLDLERLNQLEKSLDQYFHCVRVFATTDKTPVPLLEDILALNSRFTQTGI